MAVMQITYNDLIRKLGADIIDSDRFKAAEHVTHHGTETVAEHSMRVAEQACRIAMYLKKHDVDVNLTDIVRGALLHDIAMTESDVKESFGAKKAYTHPMQGAKISSAEFDANEVQTQAIERHMWPINVIPPTHKAGWIIIAADKIVSMREIKNQF